jgi:hypothetical protein
MSDTQQPAVALQYQPLEVKDFSGGMTDFYLQGDPKRYQRAENFLVNVDKGLDLRPGSIPYDDLGNHILPNSSSGNTSRVDSFITYKDESDLLPVRGRSIFYLNSTPAWTELTGPSGNRALSGGGPGKAISFGEWRNHQFVTSEGSAKPSKIYKDSTGTYQVRTAGLPLAASVPAYTTSSLLGACIRLANDLRQSMLNHMRDFSNTNPLSGVVSGYLHGYFDKYSAQYLEQQTWLGTETESNSSATPAPAATSEATLYTLVAQLSKAYNHHGYDPVVLYYHYLPYYDKSGLNSVFGAAVKGPYQAVPTTTPTTLTEAASRLDTLRTRWYWHQFAAYAHDDHNTYSILNRCRVTAPKIGVTDTAGVLSATQNYDDFIRYVNYLKNAFNFHVTDCRQGADWLSTFGPTANNKNFHVNPNGQAYPFGTYGASTPGVLYDVYPHWITLPDATDWDSACLIITWIILMYGQIHYQDAAIAAHTNFTASQTSGSASYTSVAAVGGGAITLPSNAWIMHSSLGFTASGDTGYDGNSFDNFTGARVTASGSGTATLSKKANFTLNPVTLQYSTSYFHGSYNATQTTPTTTAVKITTAAEALDSAFLNRFAIGTTDLPTSTSEWVDAAATVFTALAAHIANPLPHFVTYDIVGSYLGTPTLGNSGTNLLSGNGPFFKPEFETVGYAAVFKHTYTTEDGVEHEIISEPQYTDTIETGKIYPIGTSLESGITTSSSSTNTNFVTNIISSAPTSIATVAVGNLPVLANDLNTNYATSEVKVQIYRTVDNGNTYYLCTEVDNGTTSFTDNISDSLSSAGVDALDTRETLYTTGGVVENTPAPECRFLHVLDDTAYYGYVVDTGQVFKGRVVQSIPGIPETGPGDFSVDLSGEINGISSARTNVVVFCYESIYRLIGGFSEQGSGSITWERIGEKVGCISSNSIVKTEIGLFFAGTNGFYYTDGFQLIKISIDLDLVSFPSRTTTRAQQSKIFGSYDADNRRVYWSMMTNPTDTDADIIFVYHVNYGVKPSGVFTTMSNDTHFRPSAHAFFKKDFIRGDERGLIFKHNAKYLSDPKVPSDLSTALANWGKVHIPFDYSSCAMDFGTIYKGQWVNKIHVVGPNAGNANLQIYSVADNRYSATEGQKPLAPIRYTDNMQWGDARVNWGDDDTAWKYDGKMDFKRRFPSGTLRSQLKQIRFLPSYMGVYRSDDYPDGCTASVNHTAKSAQIASPTGWSAIEWPGDVIDMYIAFSYDNYENEFLITAIGSANILTFADPDGLVTANLSNQGWVIRGYMKEMGFSLMSYVVQFSELGERGQAYAGATGRGENA